MFSLKIQSSKVRIIENNQEHSIKLESDFWSPDDFLQHWAYEIYSLLDGYGMKFLFTSMIKRGSGKSIRAFRTVRSRNHIQF